MPGGRFSTPPPSAILVSLAAIFLDNPRTSKNMFHFRATFVISPLDKKQKERTIIFYKNYFDEFFVKQRDKVKAKIVWTFDLVEDLEKVSGKRI